MLKVKFGFDKMITYWSNKHGANTKIDGEFVNSHWYSDVDYLNAVVEINSVDEVQSALEKVLKKNYLPYEYFALMDDGRVSFNTIEDGESNIIDNEESERIEANGGQLYICDYNVYIEIQNVYEPTFKQLEEMFPNADF